MADQKPENDLNSVRSEILEIAKGLNFKGQRISDDSEWTKRLVEVTHQLPEHVLKPILTRLRTSIGEELVDLDAFSSAYSLTPAEQKLLESLAQGRSVPEHAEYYSISVNTGRVHMQRVLDKTGASGQLDLIRLLYAYK